MRTALHLASATFRSWSQPSLLGNPRRGTKRLGLVSLSASRRRSFQRSIPSACTSNRTRVMKHLQRIPDIGLLLCVSVRTILLLPCQGGANTVRLAVLPVRTLRCSFWPQAFHHRSVRSGFHLGSHPWKIYGYMTGHCVSLHTMYTTISPGYPVRIT